MKTAKKILAIVLVFTFALSALVIPASAESLGYEIGQALGTIVFSPFIVVDLLIYSIFGIHVFYW